MAIAPPRARFSISLIEDDQRRLLFLQRAPDRALGPNKWGFPAGHIEPDETPDQCAAREISEEIGPDVRLRRVRELGPIRDSFYGGIYEIHLFHWRWEGGRIHLNHEHTAYRWIGPDEHRDYDFMDGIEEDIALLEIWPRTVFAPERLPAALRIP
jgi:8-oxo-dGTP pyrophosphatase MutT (NUDIX family)